jgi:hypothetical protein
MADLLRKTDMPTLSHLTLAGTPADREATRSPDADRGVVALPTPARAGARPQRLIAGHVVLPPTGLQLPGRVSFETWLDIGRHLAASVSSSTWCLGDWLIYGETAFTGRYREAVERTSLDYQTLRNYAWVARRFPLSRRRENLSFGHHAEVAALPEPEQDFWLRKAEQYHWSRNEIRREVRASRKERGVDAPTALAPHPASSPDTSTSGPDDLPIVIQVTSDQLSLYQQAANQDGRSVQAWASVTLDRVALASLPSNGDSTDRRQLAAVVK